MRPSSSLLYCLDLCYNLREYIASSGQGELRLVLCSQELVLGNNYAYIALFAIIGVAFTVAVMWFSWVVRPTHKPTGHKAEPYECGELPLGDAWKQFRVGYYIFALVFVIFDVEAVFMFPWAQQLLHLKGQHIGGVNMGVFAFMEMIVFIAILLVGLVYAWRKGVLKWD